MPNVTRQDLENALRNADKAGDAEGARKLADALVAWKTPAQPQAGPEFEQEAPNALERLGHGASQITSGVTQRVLQVADKLPRGEPSVAELRAYMPNADKLSDDELRSQYKAWEDGGGSMSQAHTDQVNDDNALYQKGRGSDAGFDAMSLAGQVGMSLPLSRLGPKGATTLMRAGAGGAQGAAGGFLAFDPENSAESLAEQTGVGALTGAAANPVVGKMSDLVGAGVRKLLGYFKGAGASATAAANVEEIVKQIPELEAVPEQMRRDLISEAQQQIRTTGTLNAEQLSRKANLLANDVTPTKSMVTRDPADWTKEHNLQKLSGSADEDLATTGRELTNVYQRNDAALTGRLTSMGGGKATQESYGQAVMKSLDDLSDLSQEEVGKLYKHVRETAGDQLASDARNVVDTLANPDIADNAYSETLLKSITNRLRRYDMIDGEGKATANSMTVSQAEEFRKFLGSLKGDPKEDRIISQFIKATDADVIGGMGEDAFGKARAAASGRFRMLENAATQRALKAYGELTQGKTAQNFIKSQVIDGAEQDVATLIKTIEQIPDAAKRTEALNNLKGGVLTYLQEQAINANSNVISGAKLNTAIRKVGEGKLMRVLGAKDYQKLQSMARASLDATYEPAYSSVNHSNTAPTLISQAGRYAQATPLLSHSIETVKKVSAQNSARRGLAESLAARSKGELPNVSPRVARLGRSLQSMATPATPTVVNELRKRGDEKTRNRK